jgi:DNA-binding NarL/FixJ family response regulator
MWTRSHGGSVITMIRVVLADDQVLVRAGFGALLAAEDDIEVAGEAADGREAVQLAQRVKPDVVLMDIRMPVLDGIEATRRIAAEPGLGATHVVILTTFDLDEYVFEGIRAGAAGFLVKDTDPSELIRAVRVVAGGEALLSPKITLRLISEYASRSRSVRRVPGMTSLTAREREVVTLIAGGLSNEEIADKLPERLHRQDPRHEGDGQARCQRPCAAGRHRLRVRPGPPRLDRLITPEAAAGRKCTVVSSSRAISPGG